jgi:hypothetical protein
VIAWKLVGFNRPLIADKSKTIAIGMANSKASTTLLRSFSFAFFHAKALNCRAKSPQYTTNGDDAGDGDGWVVGSVDILATRTL